MIRIVGRGNHDHVDGNLFTPELRQQLETRYTRHILIQEHQVNRVLFQVGKGVRRIVERSDELDFERFLCKLGIDRCDHRIVFDDYRSYHASLFLPLKLTVKEEPSPKSDWISR